MGYLRAFVIGNLGADPEARYSANGNPVTSFRIAVNQVRTGQDGERQESTEWFKILIGGKAAEYCQRLVKGNRVLASGRLTIERYVARDGSPACGFSIWADDVQNLSPRGESAEGGEDEEGYAPQQQQRQPAAAAAQGRQRTAQAEPPDLEDLPF